MNPIRSILVATDFSPVAHGAVLRAAQLAEAFGAELVLMHVMNLAALNTPREFLPIDFDPEAQVWEEAKSKLAEEAAAVGGRIELRQELRAGVVLDELLAASESADIVVLGAYGTSLREVLLGTTAERLLRKSRKPVLVVKRAPLGAYSRVIVPVDFSSRSGAALALARHIAPTGEMNVLHVFDLPLESMLRTAGAVPEEVSAYRTRAREQARGEMRAFLDAMEFDGPQVFRLVEYGYPPKVVHDKEVELQADLVAIGKSGKGAIEALLLGSVTRHILSDCRCDVLVAPEIGS